MHRKDKNDCKTVYLFQDFASIISGELNGFFVFWERPLPCASPDRKEKACVRPGKEEPAGGLALLVAFCHLEYIPTRGCVLSSGQRNINDNKDLYPRQNLAIIFPRDSSKAMYLR